MTTEVVVCMNNAEEIMPPISFVVEIGRYKEADRLIASWDIPPW